MSALHDQGMECEMYAVNHWELALETHELNHPEAQHYVEDVFKGTPMKHIKGRRVALLWASPSCTHFSAASGGKPLQTQERAHANSVLKWCEELTVDRVILENVSHFLSWGELNAKGRPIPERKGKLFEVWWKKMEKLGYTLEKRILCAADFGAPTSRQRLFIQAVRKGSGKKLMWPQPSHSQENWLSAASIIDWSDVGTLLQDRKKPLCENTLRRIERGMQQHWGEWAEPYITILRGQSNTRSIHQPLPTISAGGEHFGLVAPIDNKSNKGGCQDPSEPLSTITGKQRQGVLQSLITGQQSCAASKPSGSNPVPTIATAGAISLVTPLIIGKHSNSQAQPADRHPVPTLSTESGPQVINPLLVNYYGTGICHETTEPVPTITTKQRQGLVVPQGLALSYRMLNVGELSRATGFHNGYKFAGNKTQVVKQIGNAVPPPFARAQTSYYIEEWKRECV